MQLYVITVLNTRIKQVHWDVCLNLKIIACIYYIYLLFCFYRFLYKLIFVWHRITKEILLCLT